MFNPLQIVIWRYLEICQVKIILMLNYTKPTIFCYWIKISQTNFKHNSYISGMVYHLASFYKFNKTMRIKL